MKRDCGTCDEITGAAVFYILTNAKKFIILTDSEMIVRIIFRFASIKLDKIFKGDIMYQLALCDDESAELDQIEKMLHSYERSHAESGFCIKKFQRAQDLIWMIKEDGYLPDILFLDIYMPGKSGMDTARELREIGNMCRIIFMTSSKEHALEAFRVDADQYLVKPILEEKLSQALDKVVSELDKEQLKYVVFQADSHVYRVAVCDIIYCEAQRKKQCIYLKEGKTILLTMTMTRLCEMLSPYGEFARVGVSYIVSLMHIESLSNRVLQMDNGKEIFLPRGSYKGLREKYFDYYFRGTI